MNRLPMHMRVTQGKQMEDLILESIRRIGVHITPANSFEDTRLKIDAWMTIPFTGQQTSLQIKYRETGDDILMEVYKDWEKRVQGRDMVGKAEYYACVNRLGQGVIVQVKDLKERLAKGMEAVEQKGWYKENGVEIKVRTDAYHGQMKCMAFINVAKSGIPVWKTFTLLETPTPMT